MCSFCWVACVTYAFVVVVGGVCCLFWVCVLVVCCVIVVCCWVGDVVVVLSVNVYVLCFVWFVSI